MLEFIIVAILCVCVWGNVRGVGDVLWKLAVGKL